MTTSDPSRGGAVERLVEEGLERYARGDLDGALMSWEGALALAPDEPRATGYVDYVRSHYDLIKGAGGAASESELSVPFGLASLGDDDPYDIEVSETGERARVEAYIEGVDDGWFIDDGLALPTVARPAALPADEPRSSPAITLELEADEPPALGDLDFGPSGGAGALDLRRRQDPRLRERVAAGRSAGGPAGAERDGRSWSSSSATVRGRGPRRRSGSRSPAPRPGRCPARWSRRCPPRPRATSTSTAPPTRPPSSRIAPSASCGPRATAASRGRGRGPRPSRRPPI